MTIVLLVLILVLAAIAAAVLVFRAARWVRDDGGPHRAPLPRHEDEWSPDLPSCPYTQRINP